MLQQDNQADIFKPSIPTVDRVQPLTRLDLRSIFGDKKGYHHIIDREFQ
ncbi:hypothetical protein NTGM5_60101 [Candidatus Nitrotoga sp. M5]|nr:hypothetical protein NTGM5_60101 [Candidatus Nitrotoga sp. M5]